MAKPSWLDCLFSKIWNLTMTNLFKYDFYKTVIKPFLCVTVKMSILSCVNHIYEPHFLIKFLKNYNHKFLIWSFLDMDTTMNVLSHGMWFLVLWMLRFSFFSHLHISPSFIFSLIFQILDVLEALINICRSIVHHRFLIPILMNSSGADFFF